MHLRLIVIAIDWMRHGEVDVKDNVKGFTWRIQKEFSLAEMGKAGAVSVEKEVGFITHWKAR